MIYPWRSNNRKDSATIEHLREVKPFYWTDKAGLRTSLKKEELAICCGSCNSSRGKKSLREWFGKPYCKARNTPINEDSVAGPVKEYLKQRAEQLLDKPVTSDE